MNQIKRLFTTEIFLLKLAFQADRIAAGVYIFLTCVEQAVPLLSVWLWKLIFDGFLTVYNTNSASYIALWLYLGIYLILQLLESGINNINDILSCKIRNKATHLMDISVMKKSAEVDVGFFDNPANQDSLTAARESGIYISDSTTAVIWYALQFITMIAAVFMFLINNWIVGVVFIATYIPGVILSFNQKKKLGLYAFEKIPYEREKNYYKFILTGEYYAKELRIYNLAAHFKKKYNELWNRLRREREKLFKRGSVITLISTLLTSAGLVFLVVYSVHSVIIGTMTVGTLVMFISLSEEAGNSIVTGLDGISYLSEIVNPRVEKFREFQKYENTVRPGDKNTVRKSPSIEFKNVYFKYPGNEQYTIKNLSFKIDSGRKIALIGINGAGKTTIIKLLLRFYEPERGQILVDGEDIKNYSPETLNSIFAVCFQTVSKYSLTLGENLALSDIARADDREAVMAAARAAGADKIIEELANGLDTDLTRNFNDEGAELSGGQWQKVALTRTFFRDSGVVILDEPSAALDPEAEDHIFSSFKKLCQDRSGILISHRLSSVMLVDEIIMVEDGQVIENGTHDELIKKNGRYAELYRMQAEKYTGGVKNENNGEC